MRGPAVQRPTRDGRGFLSNGGEGGHWPTASPASARDRPCGTASASARLAADATRLSRERRPLRLDLESEQFRRVAAHDLLLLRVADPVSRIDETDRIRLGHVVRIVGTHDDMVGAPGIDEVA